MKLALVCLLASLGACASLGLPAPQGFDQQLATAYGVHTAVVSATATALTAGTLSSAEATEVQTQERSARAMLDLAREVKTSNPTAASSDLALATTALTALQTYLNTNRSK
jgi:hypothetical protein